MSKPDIDSDIFGRSTNFLRTVILVTGNYLEHIALGILFQPVCSSMKGSTVDYLGQRKNDVLRFNQHGFGVAEVVKHDSETIRGMKRR